MDIIDRLCLDVPVLQAGMGGGVSGAPLAGAVAAAGALGTLGTAAPKVLESGIRSVRHQAPGRAVAVNLLMPFVRRRHVDVCVHNNIDVAVLFYGGDIGIVRSLHEVGAFVVAQVGTVAEAEDAIGWGVDALIAQGVQAGGHLLGREPALDFLPKALRVGGDRPVFLAGGIATAADTAAALEAGAAGAVAGTRFLLTHESGAHPLYKERVLDADETFETMLFGLGWPARHRVVANAATKRWCRADGSLRRMPHFMNNVSAPLSRIITDSMIDALPRIQQARLPFLSPTPPLARMRDATVENTPLYAGETALRIDSVIAAGDAVAQLANP